MDQEVRAGLHYARRLDVRVRKRVAQEPRSLPRRAGRVFQPLRLVAAADGQAAVDAPRGARRLDPDALGKEPEAAAGALNR